MSGKPSVEEMLAAIDSGDLDLSEFDAQEEIDQGEEPDHEVTS